MGDSIADGFEATSPAKSYVGILYEHELTKYPGLYPVSYACGGATTASVVRGPACESTTGSQLEQAESFLKSHRGSVAMLTIDIGLNDVDNCMTTSSIDRSCVVAGEKVVSRFLPKILIALHKADPGVRILGMNYYDPYLAAWLSGSSGEKVAHHSLRVLAGLNGELHGIYREYGASTANVAKQFASSDFDTVEYGNRLLPQNVAIICADTSMCSRGDLHPTDLGYDAIATSFERLLPAVSGQASASRSERSRSSWIVVTSSAAGLLAVLVGGAMMRRSRSRGRQRITRP
jgi:lysophospholipase L1-like esterase